MCNKIIIYYTIAESYGITKSTIMYINLNQYYINQEGAHDYEALIPRF